MDDQRNAASKGNALVWAAILLSAVPVVLASIALRATAAECERRVRSDRSRSVELGGGKLRGYGPGEALGVGEDAVRGVAVTSRAGGAHYNRFRIAVIRRFQKPATPPRPIQLLGIALVGRNA